MKAGIGRLTAELTEQKPTGNERLVRLINERIKPPKLVAPDDVHVRAMYIVSDDVNSQGGRFPRDEHERLISLLIDSPVLVGHRKDTLPIARTFHAESVMRDGRNWIKTYFYWLKEGREAEQLRESIDGGVIKECSISFSFRLPECSVCGRDIRLCEHEPFQTIMLAGVRSTVHFNYRKIERVLETSLVYRGAIRNTKIERLSLGESEQLLVIPKYDSIPVRIYISDGRLRVTEPSGSAIAQALCSNLDLTGCPDLSADAHLVGYRGKERCPVADTRAFLAGEINDVSRAILFLIPQADCSDLQAPIHIHPLSIRTIPYRIVDRDSLAVRASEITTRDGVAVYAWPDGDVSTALAVFHPASLQHPRRSYYSLDGHTLTIVDIPGERTVTVFDFDLQSPWKPRRFFPADISEQLPDVISHDESNGVHAVRRRDDGYIIRLSGEVEGEFGLRPVRLNGRRQYLFYRTSRSAQIRENPSPKNCQRINPVPSA